MKTLMFITIIATILFLIPYNVFPLTANEIIALKDMYVEWGFKLGWTGYPSCNWIGITCDNANGNVVRVFVKFKIC